MLHLWGGSRRNAGLVTKGLGCVYIYSLEEGPPDLESACKRYGVLSGDAVKKIKSSVIKNLVITDTIDNGEKTKNVKNIEVLPISGLMGEAIKRISNSTSVSDLFK